MYYDFYVYMNEIANFEKPFEITIMLVNSVDQEKLKGYNFNRYGQEGDDLRPHITVRMDLENKDQTVNVLTTLNQLKLDRTISEYSDNNPKVRPFRTYSMDHYLAHEAATYSAFEFYEIKIQNPQGFDEIWENKLEFLDAFLPRWLKYSGYLFDDVNGVNTSTLTHVEEMARKCGTVVLNHVDKNMITNLSLFNERLIHTFLNCICIYPTEEGLLLNNLSNGSGYENVTEFIRDLKLS